MNGVPVVFRFRGDDTPNDRELPMPMPPRMGETVMGPDARLYRVVEVAWDIWTLGRVFVTVEPAP